MSIFEFGNKQFRNPRSSGGRRSGRLRTARGPVGEAADDTSCALQLTRVVGERRLSICPYGPFRLFFWFCVGCADVGFLYCFMT
jgi:hypothetical protein